MRRIRYFIKLESEEDQIRVDFETDRGYVMALKNYLKTKSRLVFDTKVKNKPKQTGIYLKKQSNTLRPY